MIITIIIHSNKDFYQKKTRLKEAVNLNLNKKKPILQMF